ncbi:MAG TPA: acetoacetate decarboxylase family protein [Bauldia sp.]|nr:acetoacetate decarboxylase family protein [Bauldia sp.]
MSDEPLRWLRRMPYGYGPMPGPRQRIEGGRHDWSQSYRTVIGYRFLTNARQLAKLLPPGFVTAGKPIVTVEWQMLRNLPWLAGRGYNTLGIRFPAQYNGTEGPVVGSFLSVLWENLGDPIISGREELGFGKLYCEISDEPPEEPDRKLTGSWQGYTFVELTLSDIEPAGDDLSFLSDGIKSEGLLHYKYIPATGRWGEPDVAHAVLSPIPQPPKPVSLLRARSGTLRFNRGTFQQLPTLGHIIRQAADLEHLSFEGATIARYEKNNDYYAQRRIP